VEFSRGTGQSVLGCGPARAVAKVEAP
jgi:hypothetical protein